MVMKLGKREQDQHAAMGAGEKRREGSAMSVSARICRSRGPCDQPAFMLGPSGRTMGQ